MGLLHESDFNVWTFGNHSHALSHFSHELLFSQLDKV